MASPVRKLEVGLAVCGLLVGFGSHTRWDECYQERSSPGRRAGHVRARGDRFRQRGPSFAFRS